MAFIMGNRNVSRDFFEGMDRANSFKERENALDDLLLGHGFHQWALVLQVDPFCPTPDAFDNFRMVDHRLEGWAEEYEKDHLARLDPTWQGVSAGLLPRFWDEITLSTPEKKFMDRAAIDGRQVNGFSIAVPTSCGGFGFSAMDREKKASGATALEVLGAVQVFRIFAEAEMSLQSAEGHGLSFADLKLLQLVHDGFSRASIAEITGRTVSALNNRMYEIRQQFGCEKDQALLRRLMALGILRP